MKKTIFSLILLLSAFAAFSQSIIARVEIKDSIPDICNKDEVIVVLPGLAGQTEAICPVQNYEILRRLNEMEFLKNNPKFSGKSSLNVVINCKGKLVQCKAEKKSKNPQLDEQIKAVFDSLGEWKPGIVNGMATDTMRLYGLKIKKGKCSFE